MEGKDTNCSKENLSAAENHKTKDDQGQITEIQSDSDNTASESKSEATRDDTKGVVENETCDVEKESSDENGAVGGSEETFNEPCQPCFESYKQIDSILYCQECEEYLCERCVEMHQGVKLTRNHTLVSKESFEKQGKGLKKIKKEECPFHLNEFIEWFCVTDDKLCCSICKATKHNKCKRVVALSIAADTTEIQTIETEITDMQENLTNVIQKREKDISNLEKDRTDSMEVLEGIKSDTENAFEKIINALENEKEKIELKYTNQNENLKVDIENYSKVATNLDSTLKVIQKDNICNEYKFVQMKKAKEHLNAVQEVISNDTIGPINTKIGYERDKSYNEKLKAFDRFGYFDDEKMLYKCLEPRKIKILQRTERATVFFGICVIEQNRILITDYTNRTIKFVNMNEGSIERRIEVQGCPFGICKLEQGDVFAITLTNRKQVLFIDLNKFGQMITKSSFDTGENCRGIAQCNSMLFVACGGQISQNEGPGHIRIFDMTGKLQKIVMSDKFGNAIISRPWKIETWPMKNNVMVTDTKRLLTIDASNNVLEQVTNIPLKTSCNGVCFDSEGRMLVTELNSKSIKVLSTDGRRAQTVVMKLQGKLSAIAFDASTSMLFVALESSDDLLCFQLETIEWNKPPSFC